MPRAAFSAHTVRIRGGEVLPTDELCERLLGAGYTREYMVEGKGQFSVRGGIVDIYPSDSLTAVRVEFFDDEVDSIRLFDVMSQRSTQNLQEIAIPPASEAPAPHGREEAVADLLLHLMEKQKAAYAKAHDGEKSEGSLADLPLEEGEIAVPAAFTKQSRAMERFEENLQQAADQLRRGVSNRMLEKFIHLIYTQT
jgi:transcription-repair coupling factor (superfamily II helicase)